MKPTRQEIRRIMRSEGILPAYFRTRDPAYLDEAVRQLDELVIDLEPNPLVRVWMRVKRWFVGYILA